MNEFAAEIGKWVASRRDSEHSLNLKDYDRLAHKVATAAEAALEGVHPDDRGQVLEAVAERFGAPGAVKITEAGFEVAGEVGYFRDVGESPTGRVLYEVKE